MATHWNIPVISYTAATSNMGDKTVYRTLARISSTNVNSMAEAAAAVLAHYNWTKVAIATNAGVLAFDRTQAFEEVFKRRRIQVLRKVMFDISATTEEVIASGFLDELRNNARGKFVTGNL
ncbi:unnamed protein product [Gongylonema pulchrum]|uniref:ANF_receptor domain-containing protein n=1 Tax=Gongylonema pulchrum TaxID=637853 RepID=A0A183DE47_9BILA|nr:unnamed protein product [Gongylonema pulchrum]